MQKYTKFIVTCEKKEKTLTEKLFKKTQKIEIRAPYIINGFRDKINTEVYNILLIEPTKETVEMFGG